jgi:hypothetical protein
MEVVQSAPDMSSASLSAFIEREERENGYKRYFRYMLACSIFGALFVMGLTIREI